MQPTLRQLVDYVKATSFEGIKKDLELKVLAGLLYFFGLSSETSEFLSFEEISHESVRIYYHRLKKVLKPPRKKKRRLIAVDEKLNFVLGCCRR